MFKLLCFYDDFIWISCLHFGVEIVYFKKQRKYKQFHIV